LSKGDVVIVDRNSAGRPDQQGEPWFDPYDEWLGIPAQEQPPNHYRLLGASLFEADPEVIDASANRQMAYLESCATGVRVLLAQRLLNDIAAARLCLLNPARKAAYDSALERCQQKRPKPNPVRPVDKPGQLAPLSNGAPRGNSRMISVLVGAALAVAGVTGGILFIGRNRPVEKQTAELDITNGPSDRHALKVPPAKKQAAEPDIAKGIDTDAIKPIPEVSEKASIATLLGLATEKPGSPVAQGIGATTPEYHLTVLGEQVERAIRQGVRCIKQFQREDGTWDEDRANDALTGATSLATLALLTAGEKPSTLAIRKSLSFLRNYGPEELRATYAIALQTMVFAAAEPEKDRSRIAANVAWLERAQIKKGDKVLWPGSWTYSQIKGARPGDNSCTYFAMLGLNAAAEAGVPVKSEVWSSARAYWKNSQKHDGAWTYSPASKLIKGSNTCAGILCSIISEQGSGAPGGQESITNDGVRGCGSVGLDSVPRKGIEWLANHFDVRKNIGDGQQWHYYYLWGLEQAARLSGVRLLGDHDWFRLGAEELVQKQDQVSGCWHGTLVEQDRIIATSFALLFLANGRAPVLINKLRHGPRDDWDNDSSDVRNLVSTVSRDWKSQLSWQILDPDQANVADIARVPIIFFNGHENPQFSASAKQKLREYVEQGGSVFAEACCGRAEFDLGFRELIKEMFPEREHELRPLADDHPVWKAKNKLVPGSYAISGVRHGARTSIFYSSKDVSCYWNQAHHTSSSPAVSKAIRLGQNVVDYVTSRKLPPDKLSVR
jgi:Domain of unknown function (DUF4159)